MAFFLECLLFDLRSQRAEITFQLNSFDGSIVISSTLSSQGSLLIATAMLFCYLAYQLLLYTALSLSLCCFISTAISFLRLLCSLFEFLGFHQGKPSRLYFALFLEPGLFFGLCSHRTS